MTRNSQAGSAKEQHTLRPTRRQRHPARQAVRPLGPMAVFKLSKGPNSMDPSGVAEMRLYPTNRPS